jgi:hypothetical protein
LHICRLLQRGGVNAVELRQVLFHELTHVFADTEDVGYLENARTGLYNVQSLVVFTSHRILTAAELSRNASTYEHFFAEWRRQCLPRYRP